MFILGILIGIYSYIIFLLGIEGLLSKSIVGGATLIYLLFILILKRTEIIKLFHFPKWPKKDIPVYFLFFLLVLQVLINFIGVLGPEVGYDALWYHLTIPKVYLLSGSIIYIPGNLLFYSVMPKLTEMFYLVSLLFFSETGAKFIHFIFGLLSIAVIYKISRKFLPKYYSMIAVIIFYANLVVGWESVSAYVDLARTFYEIMALWGFLNFIEQRRINYLLLSSLMLGFAITTKSIALESFVIFVVLFVFDYLSRKNLKDFIKNVSIFSFVSILVPLPWFIFSFLNTGNPFYPFFDSRISIGTNFVIPNFSNTFKDIFNLFVYSNDPISPIYLIVLPLILIGLYKEKGRIKYIFLYSILSLVAWYFTPRIGGGRFILPYLAGFSVASSYAIYSIKENFVKKVLISMVILIFISSMGYRLAANKRYIPVILGQETKSQYLKNHLNFSFGDFYDVDSYFAKNIKPSDKVLLFGFHNLYYVDFPFIDSSYIKKGDKFNYIAIQDKGILPARFSNWKLIYYNDLTKVKLYSDGGKVWEY